MTPEIAIVDSNTLSCLGLQNLLEEIIPTAVIRSFRSFGELMDDTPDMYVHYFISSQIYRFLSGAHAQNHCAGQW